MSDGIAYRVTRSPSIWAHAIHDQHPRGYAYQAGDHFVHIYGSDVGWRQLSVGLSVSEQRVGSLRDWATRVYGAEDIVPLEHDVGTVVDGVWRPGLYFEQDMEQAFGNRRPARRVEEQSLYSLVDRLNELLQYVHPVGPGLEAYGPKQRELLILAATEAENVWVRYLERAGAIGRRFTTNDYVKLKDALRLDEYQVWLTAYGDAPAVWPLKGWLPERPTGSLPWYDAYNAVKHDRAGSLHLATVRRCIEAVAANLVLFVVRFGPDALYESVTPVSALVNHLLTLVLDGADPATFYVPSLKLEPGWRNDLFAFQGQRYTLPWRIRPLKL